MCVCVCVSVQLLVIFHAMCVCVCVCAVVSDIPRHVCAVSFGLMHSHIVLGIGKQHHYHHVSNDTMVSVVVMILS